MDNAALSEGIVLLLFSADESKLLDLRLEGPVGLPLLSTSMYAFRLFVGEGEGLGVNKGEWRVCVGERSI